MALRKLDQPVLVAYKNLSRTPLLKKSMKKQAAAQQEATAYNNQNIPPNFNVVASMDDAPVGSLNDSLGIYQDQEDSQHYRRQQPNHLQTISAIDSRVQYSSILDAAHSYNNLFVKQPVEGLEIEREEEESSAGLLNPCD